MEWMVAIGVVAVTLILAGVGGWWLGGRMGEKAIRVEPPELKWERPVETHHGCITPTRYAEDLRAAYERGLELGERLAFGPKVVGLEPTGPPEPQDVPRVDPVWANWPVPVDFPDPTDGDIRDDEDTRIQFGGVVPAHFAGIPKMDLTGEEF